MFTINDDLSIHATRGDTVFFTVTADENGTPYFFEAGDVLRMKIFGKKDATSVVLEKLFPVTARTDRFTILLTEDDTKIDEVISKPKDYWYEIELNPFTNPQTIIGYDEDGPKVFKLFPEGKDSEVVNPEPRVIAAMDDELDMTSTRPVQNQAIARAIVNIAAACKVTEQEVAEKAQYTSETLAGFGSVLAAERQRIDNFVSGGTVDGSEVVDVRVGGDGINYDSAGGAVRGQYLHGLNNAKTAGVFAPYAMRNGAINSANGEWAANHNRMTTTDFIRIYPDNKLFFFPNEKYDYSILFYSTDRVFLYKETGWIHTDYTFTEDGYIKINFKKRDDTQIFPDEALEIQSYLKIGNMYPLTEEARKIAEAITREHLAHFGISIKFISVTYGTFGATSTVPGNRGVTDDFVPVEKGEKIAFEANSTYKFGYRFYDEEKNYDGVDHGWNTTDKVMTMSGYVKINFARLDDAVLTEEDFAKMRDICKIVRMPDNEKKDNSIQSISVEYGRYNGASYVFARIPKTTNSGDTVTPKLHLTSDDESIDGAKKSALSYARVNNSIFTINAGLFNVSNMHPVGQTIIDGTILVSEPMADDNGSPISDDECYPLCIDAKGNLSAPYDRSIDTATMIADGVVYAITGWGKIIDNFTPCSDTVDNEIVHKGKYIRQVIGQFQNEDYFVCTVDQSRGRVENEDGLTYAELAQLLADKGVKFAYSLDGGGSAETVIGVRQLNPIYEGTVGRAVPTVITFE